LLIWPTTLTLSTTFAGKKRPRGTNPATHTLETDHSRFLINLPPQQLSDAIALGTEIEQAHWFVTANLVR